MIPLRDTIRSRTVPVVTMALIAANVAMFLVELSKGDELHAFLIRYGLVPARFILWEELGGPPWSVWRYVPFASSMFLHGGWVHLLGNMLYLWIFADNVEDRMGHLRFLVFYLLSGVLAAAAQVWVSPDVTVPTVGASGAIAGVLGAYMLLYPGARIVTFVPIFFLPWFVEVPAIAYLGLWFVMQFLSGTMELAAAESAGGGVAWWAHAGGFVAGMVLLPLFLIGRPRLRPRQDFW